MKTIIPLLALCTLLPPLSLLGQNDGVSTARLAQNANEVDPISPAGEAGNNQNSQSVPVQQNHNVHATGGYGGGGQGGLAGIHQRLQNVISRFPGTGQASLIIRSSDMNAKDEANLQEDLAVMAHILKKSLEDLPTSPAQSRTAMGINLFVTPNAGMKESMYLEGYGALFLLHVGFPVVAPASSDKEEKPSGDSTWEEARQELYGQSSEAQILASPGEDFSEEKVARLKEALLRALKNATNIRGLEGDITVCVLGGANTFPANTAKMYSRSGGGGGGAVGQLLVASNEAAPSRGTVLTLKVTKADIDAFAKGELKFADFQKRARMVSYTTAAAGSNNMEALWAIPR